MQRDSRADQRPDKTSTPTRPAPQQDRCTPREKVQGLAEAVSIIRGLWSQQSLTFAGARYQTEAARIEPKPRHRIPIWLGTFGDRALAVTGQLADGWIPSLGHAPPEQAKVMRDRVLTAAHQAGREPGEITCGYHLEIRVDDHAAPRAGLVTGSAGAVAEQLIGFVKLGFTALGFTALSFAPAGPGPLEQAQRLASEVIPAVRGAV